MCALALSFALAQAASAAVRPTAAPPAQAGVVPSPGVQVAAGNSYSCALSNGFVSCWGNNTSGQLGNGAGISPSVPIIPVSSLTGARAIAAAASHTCAVLNAGTVKCWGSNSSGELGNGTTVGSTVPVSVAGLSGVTALALGNSYSCALQSTGTVKCWGFNSDGELGNGSRKDSSVPVSVVGLSGVTAIGASNSTVCAVVGGGAVKCWGGDFYGFFGISATGSSAVPVTIAGVTKATAVAPGSEHICALLSGGSVTCWGFDDVGQLGNGQMVREKFGPATIVGLSGATAIASGNSFNEFSCALISGGTIKCWGDSYRGKLGTGKDTGGTVPAQVVGINNATHLALGAAHACAGLASGTVSCWGEDTYGELGNAPVSSVDTPRIVPGISDARAVAAGEVHSCALLTSGGVTCWGSDFPYSSANPPRVVSGVTGAIALATDKTYTDSGYHSCVLLNTGKVVCWGDNASGQLGNGTKADVINQVQPVTVSNLTGATAITVGDAFSCAIISGGTVRCWGDNTFGQLGNATTTASSTPVTVSGLTGATAITAGAQHVCVIVASGAVKCWGDNSDGELGTGKLVSGSHSTIPVSVAGLTGAKSISAGAYPIFSTPLQYLIGESGFSCASLTTGRVRCWGKSLSEGPSQPAPVEVPNVSGATKISAGGLHACARLSDATATCWGANFYGQLGNGGYYVSNRVTGLMGVSSISAGFGHTCAVANSIVSCWGDNQWGQLGIPSFAPAATPTTVVAPNLVVTSVHSSPAAPTSGQAVRFSATVENTGTAPTPVDTIIGVIFKVDGRNVGWSDTDTTPLAPGASVTLTANGGPAGVATWTATAGAHEVFANVDDIDRISETNETDNTLTIPIDG